MEARVCAEDPFRAFLPSTGPLVTYREPPGAARGGGGAAPALALEAGGVTPARPSAAAAAAGLTRVDAGVREGDAIGVFYDPMISKLCAWASDRGRAAARRRARQLRHRGRAAQRAVRARGARAPRIRRGRGLDQVHREHVPRERRRLPRRAALGARTRQLACALPSTRAARPAAARPTRARPARASSMRVKGDAAPDGEGGAPAALLAPRSTTSGRPPGRAHARRRRRRRARAADARGARRRRWPDGADPVWRATLDGERVAVQWNAAAACRARRTR